MDAYTIHALNDRLLVQRKNTFKLINKYKLGNWLSLPNSHSYMYSYACIWPFRFVLLLGGCLNGNIRNIVQKLCTLSFKSCTRNPYQGDFYLYTRTQAVLLVCYKSGYLYASTRLSMIGSLIVLVFCWKAIWSTGIIDSVVQDYVSGTRA